MATTRSSEGHSRKERSVGLCGAERRFGSPMGFDPPWGPDRNHGTPRKWSDLACGFMQDLAATASASTTHIYALNDPRDGHVRYIGKADDVARRLREHISGHARPSTSKWIEELSRRGLEPTMTILATVAKSRWQEAEKFQIALFRSRGYDLLNLAPGGNAPYIGDGHLSAAHRKRIGDAHRGKSLSVEHRRAIGLSNKTNPLSLEHWRTVHEAQRNIPLSEDHKRKLSEAVKVSKKAAEQRQRLCKSNVGRPFTDERRQNISDALRNSPAARKHLRQLQDARIGKPVPEGTRQKMSQAATRRWARERARLRPCRECGVPFSAELARCPDCLTLRRPPRKKK